MHFLVYQQLDSTNSELQRLVADGCAADGTVVMAHAQSAGRGQRGNSWESEPGANVTMSILLPLPPVEPRLQQRISEAVALGVAETLDELGLDARVKWPNDIYVGDRKISGILIENRISSSVVERSVAGIGLNVNQREFFSDAPNPVSIRQLTGIDHDPDSVARAVALRVLNLVSDCNNPAVHERYMARLWRREGIHRWSEPGDVPFDAAIADVLPTGHLVLRLADGTTRTYAFKEVAACLD